MRRFIVKALASLSAMVVAIAVALAGFAIIKDQGWLSVVGIESTSRDSQVVMAVERIEEVALLRLAVQGIKSQEEKRTIGGWGVPGASETLYMQYEFQAKLGIDGSRVEVTREGEGDYRVVIPEFIFIGYDKPNFEVAVEDGGVLSFVTPDVDQAELVNEILGDSEQDTYIEKNEEDLRDQARSFYVTLIRSVDPEAKTTFEFAG